MEVDVVLLLVLACTCQNSAIALTDWHYDGDNVAYMKPTLQRPQTYCYPFSSGGMCFYARLAVDNHTNANFTDGSCTHTIGNNKIEASWTVDLQKPYKITGIIIYNRKELRYRLQNFQIYGDTKCIYDSFGTQDYNESIISIPLPGTHSFTIITIKLPTNGGHSDDEHFYLSLCEVQIYAASRPACSESTKDIFNGHSEVYNTTERLVEGMYTVGTIIRILCIRNYSLNGSQFLECLDTGHFNHSTPACLDPLCIIPNVSNGKFLNLMSTKFVIGTTLQFTCNPGFTTATSKETTVCLEDHQWSVIPECIVLRSERQNTDNDEIIGGTSGAAVILAFMVSFLIVYIIRRRKRLRQSKEETSLTYTQLQQRRNDSSEINYAEMSEAQPVRSGPTDKASNSKAQQGPVYCNMVIEHVS